MALCFPLLHILFGLFWSLVARNRGYCSFIYSLSFLSSSVLCPRFINWVFLCHSSCHFPSILRSASTDSIVICPSQFKSIQIKSIQADNSPSLYHPILFVDQRYIIPFRLEIQSSYPVLSWWFWNFHTRKPRNRSTRRRKEGTVHATSPTRPHSLRRVRFDPTTVRDVSHLTSTNPCVMVGIFRQLPRVSSTASPFSTGDGRPVLHRLRYGFFFFFFFFSYLRERMNEWNNWSC